MKKYIQPDMQISKFSDTITTIVSAEITDGAEVVATRLTELNIDNVDKQTLDVFSFR